MTRGLVVILGLLLGGCSFDAFGVGDGGGDQGSSTGGSSSGSDSETSGAPATAGGTGTGEGSGSSSGASLDDTGSTGSTSSTTATTTDDASTGDGSTTGDAPTPFCPALAELAACYDFADVGRGTLWDGSGNGNHGTAAGVGVTVGPFGEAATFDAVSELAVPDSPSLDIADAITFEAWVMVDSVPATGRTGIIDNEGQYSLMVYASNEYRCSAASEVLFVGPVVQDAWTHVACTYDGTTLRLYVDGTEVGMVPMSGPINTDDPEPMSIGDTSPDFEEPLDGAIGGVRVWSTALAPATLCEAAGPACTD